MRGSSQNNDWRRNQFAVTAASFIGFTGFTLVMPFLPLYFQQLGIADVGEVALWSGLSLGVTPAITAILAPVWGRLADRLGRKIMVERSLVSFVLVMTAFAYVTRPWHVLALRALQGLFAGYGSLCLTMAAESAPEGRMASSIGAVQTAQRLGPALGPILGGLVAQTVGIRRTFLLAAFFYAAAFILVLVMFRERSVARTANRDADGYVSFRNVLAFQNFVLLMCVIFGLQYVDRSFGPVLPLYIARTGTAPDRVPLVAGLLFSLAAGFGAFGHHLCSRLLKVMSARVVISSSIALVAAGVAVYPLTGRVAALAVATVVLGLGMGIAMTAAYTAAGSIIPAGAHGTGFGLLTTASLGGMAFSPLVAGSLGATSIRAVFVLDLVALVALAAIVSRVMVERQPFKTESPVVEEA